MRRNQNILFDEQQQTDRWLISYADFITLLFAFFVVMYSISQVNENKYQILSTSLEKAFDTRVTSMKPIQIGELSRNIHTETVDDNEQVELKENVNDSFATTEEFEKLERDLRQSLGGLIDQKLADIQSDANWINITLRSGLLFPSGSDVLNQGANNLLEEVAKHINTNNQLILVHGHTDNIPINSERFPSNWELSSARAVAVVRNLQNLSVYAPRLSIQGHGEYQPLAANDSVENRAKNRRVVISISRKQKVSDADNASEVNADVTLNGDEIKPVLNEGQVKDEEPQFEIITLPGGGILIRGKDLPTEDENKQ